MKRDEALAIFKAYFDGEAAIYEHFGVEKFNTYDYELQLNEDTWAVIDRGFGGSQIHWALPDEENCRLARANDVPVEAMYAGDIHGIYRREHFTLVFTPSSTGHAGFGYIFDNLKEDKEWTGDD